MAKKKILIVAYDDIETKFLLNDIVLNKFLKNKEIFCLTKANKEFFVKNVLNIRDDIKYVDYNPFNNSLSFKLTFSLLYKVTQFFEYMANLAYSESSFQKFFLFIGFKEEQVLKKNFFFRNKFLKRMLSSIGKLFNFNYMLLLKHCNKNSDFDYVLFPRPDSYYNLKIYNKFVSKKTKVLTLIRNFDTPALKRVFVIDSDITFYYEDNIKILIKKLINSKKVGKLCRFPYYLDYYINTDGVKNSMKSKTIIFATSQEQFIIGEYTQKQIIKMILSHLDDSYKLVIRLHPSVNKKDYEEFKSMKNVELQEEIYTSFYDKNNNVVKLPTRFDINNYIKTLLEASMLISFGSTIVYDALKLGVNCYFLDFCNNSAFYEREHLKVLLNMGVKKIDNINDLINLIKGLN